MSERAGASLPGVCWLVACLLLLAPLLLRFAVLVTTAPGGLRDIIHFIYDDGYYYLGMAANIAESGHSTLDGLTATNGYQPLWQWMLAGLARLSGTQPREFFTASCALIYVLACAAPALALAIKDRDLRRAALCLAAGLALVTVQQPAVFLMGLEPILILPLALPLVLLIERGASPRVLPALSAVLACVFLVRLDALALFFSALAWLPLFEVASGRAAPRAVPRLALRTGLKLSLFVLPTVAAYLCVNQWLFGTPVPVSGLAKAIGSAKFSNWGAIRTFYGHWKSIALLIAILLPLEALARRSASKPGPLFLRSMVVVSSAILLQCFYYGAFSAWQLWPWYAYLVALDTALVIARIIHVAAALSGRPVARLPAGAALLILGLLAARSSASLGFDSLPPSAQARLAILGSAGIKAIEPPDRTSFNQVSLDMLDEFFTDPQRTLIVMGDRAGGLSYWGRERLSVLQSEGLTLDVAYLRARAANAGEGYFERFPIRYLVIDRERVPTVPGPAGVTFVVPEPVQGRVTTASVPTFCFPSSALHYRKSYGSVAGPESRMAFSFPERIPCTPEALALVRSIETGVGLRQYSLPSEYAPGGPADKRSEDRDRGYHGPPAGSTTPVSH
jgi:hypothetical protein